MYPKIEGGIYVYDPSDVLSDDDSTSLAKELESKVSVPAMLT